MKDAVVSWAILIYEAAYEKQALSMQPHKATRISNLDETCLHIFASDFMLMPDPRSVCSPEYSLLIGQIARHTATNAKP